MTLSVPEKEAIIYRRLFNMRQTGDYEDFFDWEEIDVRPIIPNVEILLENMSNLIRR